MSISRGDFFDETIKQCGTEVWRKGKIKFNHKFDLGINKSCITQVLPIHTKKLIKLVLRYQLNKPKLINIIDSIVFSSEFCLFVYLSIEPTDIEEFDWLNIFKVQRTEHINTKCTITSQQLKLSYTKNKKQQVIRFSCDPGF